MEGKVFYVWFDAPIEYIAATARMGRRQRPAPTPPGERWWRTDEGADDVRYVQFMGKDNVPFHTLSFPATILGSGEPWKLVDYIKSFNYLNYDGGKFSTRQGRGVFMDQALEILPRRLLALVAVANVARGLGRQLHLGGFQAGVNKDLADVLGNFVSRVTKFAARPLRRRGARGRRATARPRRRSTAELERAAARLRGADGGDRAPQGGAGAARHLGRRQRVPAGRRALDRDRDRPRPRRRHHPLRAEPDAALRGAVPARSCPMPRDAMLAALGLDARRLARRRRGGARRAARRPSLRGARRALRQARRRPPRRARGPLRRRRPCS